MAKARRDKLTLNVKIHLIDESRTHSQRQPAELFNVEAECKLRQTPIKDFFYIE